VSASGTGCGGRGCSGTSTRTWPGQLIRVTGPNGCGKSTLLRLVGGASAPTRGRITARPRAGYVPERFPAELPFTARGYLRHLGRLHGLRGAPLEAAVTASIGRFGLGPYAGKPLRELSKGNSQKVAVAQALLGGPELLAGGVVLAVLGAGFELATTMRPRHGLGHLAIAGVAAAVTCLLIGSAIGALCNPPLIRHRGYATMSTAAVAIVAIAASGSPANAAIRATAAGHGGGYHLPFVPVAIAVALAGLTWAVSVLAAPHRAS
jgi:hypothetical protein